MARFVELGADREGPALIALDGFAARGDHERFAEAARGVLDGPPRPIHLDFSGLTSMTHELAREVTRLRRAVHDRDGVVTFSGLNVVVRWVLQRGFGTLPLLEADLPPEYADERPSPADEVTVLPPLPGPVDTARPLGPSVEAIRDILAGSPVPADWAAPLDALIGSAGLGLRVHLFHRDGDRLRLSTRSDHAFEADGWLGSLLAAAGRVLDVKEVGEDGLSLTERAALLWSGADLLVPAVAAGRLQGVVMIFTGRETGYQALRSGEVLALTLFGELLGARLAAILPAPPIDAPPVVSIRVPVGAGLPEAEPVLV